MISPEERTSNRLYDRIAQDYSICIDSSYVQFLKYLLLERYAAPSDVCLDIGIATGIFSIPLAASVKEIHGIDISSAMLKECQNNLNLQQITTIHLHEMSAARLDFSSESFDLVYSFSTLLLVPEIKLALREIARVLKPAGHGIIDITGKYNLSQIRWGRYYKQLGHFGVHAFSLRQIKASLSALDFDILEIHATGLLDQWKYIPGIHYMNFLDRLTHAQDREPDLDYRVSQRLPHLANRWYLVLKKR